MRRRWFVVLPLLLAVFIAAEPGCKRGRPSSFTYQLVVEDSIALPVEGMKVDGTALKMVRQNAKAKTFETAAIPSSHHLVDRTITVTVSTTCGPADVAAKAMQTNATVEDFERERVIDERKKEANPSPSPIIITPTQFKAPDLVLIYLDNEGSSAPVTVGNTTVIPPSMRVSIGTSCANALEVKVGPQSVGNVSAKPRTSLTSAKTEDATAFVDVAGNHCYEMVPHTYVEKTQSTSTIDPGKVQKLEGLRLYSIEIDDFLKPPPKELTTVGIFPTRNEIRRCPPTTTKKKPAPKR